MKPQEHGPRTRTLFRKGKALLLGVATLGVLFGVFASSAQAFTLQGGTDAQRAQVTKTIKACAVPYTATDAELKFLGPVKVIFAPMNGISGYSEMGRLFVNSSLTGDALSELVAHEWAHQIWYTLGPKWWAKWADVCNASPGSAGGDRQEDPRENFAECAKVALWGSDYLLRDYAVTGLRVTAPGRPAGMADHGPLREQVPLQRSCPVGHVDHRGPGRVGRGRWLRQC